MSKTPQDRAKKKLTHSELEKLLEQANHDLINLSQEVADCHAEVGALIIKNRRQEKIITELVRQIEANQSDN